MGMSVLQVIYFLLFSFTKIYCTVPYKNAFKQSGRQKMRTYLKTWKKLSGKNHKLRLYYIISKFLSSQLVLKHIYCSNMYSETTLWGRKNDLLFLFLIKFSQDGKKSEERN